MSVKIIDCSMDNLFAPGQIGWVSFKEGDAVLTAKVVRGSSGYPFVCFPTAYGKGIKVEVVYYPDRTVWAALAKELLDAFVATFGKDYVFGNRRQECPPRMFLEHERELLK